jgi:hypothetical protein
MSIAIRLIASLLALAAASAHAGGPLSVCNTPPNAPIKYAGTGTVNLSYDQGTLGTRSKAVADQIVTNAVALWTNVGTASVVIGHAVADLPVDVTVANYKTYYGITNDGINPVIYDTDGTIIDDLLGAGQSAHILGFAGSSYFLAPTCQFTEGQAVINGKIAVTDATMGIVLAHEIGHLIGLDHTQINSTQGIASSVNYPLMYPIANRNTLTLHEDDIAAVSALYPDPTLSSVYGQISGTFVLADGVTPVKGANLWATEISTGKLYSIVSDYLTQNTGFFKLLLPAGNYNLRAGTILPNFIGGSSVGPYSNNATDLSFQPPLYSGATAMPTVTLGNASPTAFAITAGCAATLTFRINGTGTVGGTCGTPGFVLDIGTSGTGTGNVTSSPAGINCGATCSASFVAGTPVTLTASPTGGSIFFGWSGACTGTGTCIVTMNAQKSVTATFLPPAAATEIFPPACQLPAGWTKPVTANSSWSVVSNDATEGVCSLKSNPIADSQKAQIQVQVTLATGNITFNRRVSSESGFDCFRFYIDGIQQIAGSCNGGTGVGGTGASGTVPWGAVSVPVTGTGVSRVLTWSFEKDGSVFAGEDAAYIDAVVLPLPVPVTLTTTKSGNGAGTITGAIINCGATCTQNVTSGTVVALSAAASAGSTFTGWSGGGCSGTGACNVTVNAATTVTATFTLQQFTLTSTRAGTGTGTITSAPVGINCGASCAFAFDFGTMVTLTATPSVGSTFSGWSGGGCSGTGTCIITISAVTTVTATFNISASPPGAPTNVTATPGNAQALIAFTAPASDGGSPIINYTATCNPNALTGTASASPINVTNLSNNTLYACSVTATNSNASNATGAASATVNVTPFSAAPPALISVASRKIHGGATPFDFPINLIGPLTVEPRASANGHLIVFHFNNAINTVAGVTVTDSVPNTVSATATISPNGTDVVVTIPSLADNKRVTITLSGVSGPNGAAATPPVSMGFLVGDFNSSRSVSAADISAVKTRSGLAASLLNFKFDVNSSGDISSTDVSAVKVRSGLVLP